MESSVEQDQRETQEQGKQPFTKGRRRYEGVVVSNKMDKTAVVRVVRRLVHPICGKVINRHKKYYVHDERNGCQVGDRVLIVEHRPISKLKSWVLVDKDKGKELG